MTFIHNEGNISVISKISVTNYKVLIVCLTDIEQIFCEAALN